MIDFRRDKDGIEAKVAAIEYDPNRSARIALLHYGDGEKRYILAPVGLAVGNVVMSGESADIRPGNCLPLRRIPVGTIIHNIELKIGKGAQIVRSAGTSAQLMAKEGVYATVKLPSGECGWYIKTVKPPSVRLVTLITRTSRMGRLVVVGGSAAGRACEESP